MIIIMIFNLECTSSNPKDHSCEVSLQSDKNNIFSTFMVIMAMVAILKYVIINAQLHIPKNAYEVSLQLDQNVFLPFMVIMAIFTCYSKHNNNNNNNDNNIIIIIKIIIKIKIIINGI